MAVKVIVPNKQYNEHYFGAQFKNGEAVFEDEQEAKKIADRLGYTVEKIQEKKTATKAKPKTATRKTTAKKTATKKPETKKED